MSLESETMGRGEDHMVVVKERTARTVGVLVALYLIERLLSTYFKPVVIALSACGGEPYEMGVLA